MQDIRVIPTEFSSEGALLRGDFVIPQGDGPFPGICKFHGLPGSPDQVSGISTKLAEAGFLVLTFDFRGFRRSEGVFSLAGEVTDAESAITHLINSNLVAPGWVGVYGASYGGAVAACAAARDSRISAVCLRAPIYDTHAFALSPLIRPEVNRILKETPDEMHGLVDPITRKRILDLMVDDGRRFNPMNEVSKISPRPLLVITGDADVGVDVDGVRGLHDLAGEPKELVIVEGADHMLSDPRAYEDTVSSVVAWFQGVCTTNVTIDSQWP
jgi:dipeptidyl aminopeptidase/acylaminoacyl peptidase